MTTVNALERLEQVGIIPIATVQSTEDALRLADALLEGGLSALEITFRSTVTIDALEAVVREHPNLLVAAGTVLTPKQATRAVNAGAHLIVSPGTFPRIIRKCQKKNVPTIPGVATATEIGIALQLGVHVLKFFPAELGGGVGTLKALRTVYPNVRFVPTGGISAANLSTYLAAPEVLACGGSWLVHQDIIARGQFDRIVQLTREAVTIVREMRP